MSEWIIGARLPKYDDRNEFEVWIRNRVRSVRRVGNRGAYAMLFSPGQLIYTDCSHTAQNMICDECDIDGWRIKEVQAPLPEAPEQPIYLSGYLSMSHGQEWMTARQADPNSWL